MSDKKLLVALIGVVIVILVLGIMLVSNTGQGSVSNGSGSDQISLLTNPDPPKVGSTTFTILVKDDSGKPVDNANVSFDLNMTTMNMGKQSGTATSQGNGKYAAVGKLSMRGPWKVSTTVKMPDGSTKNKDFVVSVP